MSSVALTVPKMQALRRASDQEEALQDGMPTMIVGRSYSDRPLRLGLEQPMELRGGERIGPDGIAAEVPLEWVHGLIPLVATACHDQTTNRRPWFQLPPLALARGRPGDAAHIARTLARHVAVPFFTMDLSGPDGEALVGAKRPGQEMTPPPLPVVAMASSGCANPVILLTGIENIRVDVASAVGAMLDSETCRNWPVASLGGLLDLSAVTWVVAIQSEHLLPTPIYSRVTTFPLGKTSPAQERLRTLSLLLEAMADLEFDSADIVRAVRQCMSSRMIEIEDYEGAMRFLDPEYKQVR